MRPGSNATLVLSSLVFEYGCDAMILLDSEFFVRALNPAAQALLDRRIDEAGARLDCRSVLGCRTERPRVAENSGSFGCLCEQVMLLHRSAIRQRMRIRPYGRREMLVSASCAPMPVDHLGGVVLALRPLEQFGDTLEAGELRVGALRMDVARHQLFVDGQLLHLARIDFDLLRYLLVNAERVVSREDLIAHVWRYQQANDRDLIKSHIGALRRRLRDAGMRNVEIKNVYGVGYMLSARGCRIGQLGAGPEPGDAGDWW